MKTTASATDCNRRAIGLVQIEVEFANQRPLWIEHCGQVYGYTGKSGTSLRTGEPMHELATEGDQRIWSNGDATRIEED